MDLVEICNVCTRKVIIKAAKRIFNSDKICRSYCDLYFGVTFLEHTVYHAASRVVKYCEKNTLDIIQRRRSITAIAFEGQKTYTATQTSKDRLNSRSTEIGCLLAYFFSSLRP